jgi:hypothetical protein
MCSHSTMGIYSVLIGTMGKYGVLHDHGNILYSIYGTMGNILYSTWYYMNILYFECAVKSTVYLRTCTIVL